MPVCSTSRFTFAEKLQQREVREETGNIKASARNQIWLKLTLPVLGCMPYLLLIHHSQDEKRKIERRCVKIFERKQGRQPNPTWDTACSTSPYFYFLKGRREVREKRGAYRRCYR